MNPLNNLTSSVQPALNSGLASIAAGTQRLNRDAQQIANPDESSTGSLLDLSQASLQSQAGADVLHTADQMLGSLLNAFA
jgi:hypothetical protein